MICRIEFSPLKIKSISSARWPQLGPGLIVGTSHRSARMAVMSARALIRSGCLLNLYVCHFSIHIRWFPGLAAQRTQRLSSRLTRDNHNLNSCLKWLTLLQPNLFRKIAEPTSHSLSGKISLDTCKLQRGLQRGEGERGYNLKFLTNIDQNIFS